MNSVVVFDLRGTMAHYRRPDTLGTHASYPFPTRTALHGIVASILGLTSISSEVRIGLRLLNPVRTVAQELSMHGKTWESTKGDASSFHRPTSIELIVEPHYRIYVSGNLVDELSQRLCERQSHFHTYLGSAFCLTFPEWKAKVNAPPINPVTDQEIICSSVVPIDAVNRLLPQTRRQYARIGGIPWNHEGEMFERKFRGRAIALIYEVDGNPIHFRSKVRSDKSYWSFVEVPGEGSICLW